MPDFENPLRRIWAEGRTAVNGWLSMSGILSTEIMARAGWDSLTIDMQHGTADYADMLAMLAVIQQTPTVPMVRARWNDPAHIMQILDAGALGVICPMIESVDDAARFVSCCRYPPQGTRSFGPIRARYCWGEGYVAGANDAILPIAMIETKSALENLEQILRIDGLGGIYIGPVDLGMALGYPPGLDRREPGFIEVVEHILAEAKRCGVPVGIHCGGPEYAKEMAKKGASLVTAGTDARFVEIGCAQAMRGIGRR